MSVLKLWIVFFVVVVVVVVWNCICWISSASIHLERFFDLWHTSKECWINLILNFPWELGWNQGMDISAHFSLTWMKNLKCFGKAFHCMKSGIFISKQHCRLSWKFRFTTAHDNLQATPKTAMNCWKLAWALLGGCPPMTPLPLILGEDLTWKWKCCELYKRKSE